MMTSVKRPLSKLESLPYELLIQIYNASCNPNFVFCSLHIYAITAYESIRRDLVWRYCNNASERNMITPHPRCGLHHFAHVPIEAILDFDDFIREDWLTIAHMTDAALQWMKAVALYEVDRQLLRPNVGKSVDQETRGKQLATLTKLLASISRPRLAALAKDRMSYSHAFRFFHFTLPPCPASALGFNVALQWPPAVEIGTKLNGTNGYLRRDATFDFLSMYVQHHLPHPVTWFEIPDVPVTKAGRFWDDWFSRAKHTADSSIWFNYASHYDRPRPLNVLNVADANLCEAFWLEGS